MTLCRNLPGWLALFFFAVLPAAAGAEEKAKDVPLPQRMKELEDMVQSLKTEMNLLTQSLRAVRLQLDALPKNPVSPPLFQQTGTIRLENRLGVPTTVIINDTPYRLQPFQTRNLTSYQAGPFTFEVLVEGYGSLQAPASRVLRANTEYTLFTYLP